MNKDNLNRMKWCHHDPFNFLDVEEGNVSYYVADRIGVRNFTGDLVVNLTEHPGTRTISTTYNIPLLAKHMKKLPDELVLGWNDFSAPPVEFTFWEALHTYVKRKKYSTVCFHCEHGHGRTGTAACAMLIVLSQLDVVTAVNYIRESYCNQTVESENQINYLIALDEHVNGNKDDSESLIQDLSRPINPSEEESNDDPFDLRRYIR